MRRTRRVVITGIGPVANVGIGKRQFWKGLLKGKAGPQKTRNKVLPGEIFSVYRVENFNIKNFVDEKVIQDIKKWKEGKESRDLYYALAATKLALQDSKLKYDRNFNNIGMIFTSENPGIGEYAVDFLNAAYKFMRSREIIPRREFAKKWIKVFDKPTYELQTFMPLYHLTKAFGLHGYSLFINNACASGLYAIEAASQIIEKGICPAVVVVASDAYDVFKYLWFKELGLYAEDGVIRPFSSQGRGFVIGEGGAAIVMEELMFARKRKAHIYAEYTGGSFSLEGWKVTLPAVWSNFYERVMEGCLKKAGINKKDIDLINAHGVGVSMIDRYEIKAIKNVFGEKVESQPLVTCFKPYVGHTLGLNALLEIVILLLCMENKLILPTLNHSPLISKINIVNEKMRQSLRNVLKITCAFAGYLGACLFRRADF